MFGQKLHIDKNVASTCREVDGYRITITVERLDVQPITDEDLPYSRLRTPIGRRRLCGSTFSY
jgi:hypothetical protein